MNIIYFANGIRGLRCLEAMLDSNYKIVAVIGHSGSKSDVIKYAEQIGINTYQPDKINNNEFVNEMRSYNPDLFVLSGYNRILKAELIDVPLKGCINLHGGKLPEYRGCAPINWQIINGETKGGCCILFVDEGIDTGNIISQSHYEISENDTSQDIVQKQLELFPSMLLKALKNIESGELTSIPQNMDEGCYYTRRYPRDGLIKWDKYTAKQIYDLVRSLFDPYPNAFSFYRNEKMRIRKVQRIKPPIKGIPGRIPMKMNDGVVVCCKDESLLITEVALGDEGEPINPKDICKIGSDFTDYEI